VFSDSFGQHGSRVFHHTAPSQRSSVGQIMTKYNEDLLNTMPFLFLHETIFTIKRGYLASIVTECKLCMEGYWLQKHMPKDTNRFPLH